MTSSWTCLWRCTAGSHRTCISLWGITLSLGVLCNIGYPSETHLKLKSREISFVNNIRVYNSIVLKFCTECSCIMTVLCAKLYSTEYYIIYFPVYGQCDMIFRYGVSLLNCFSQSRTKYRSKARYIYQITHWTAYISNEPFTSVFTNANSYFISKAASGSSWIVSISKGSYPSYFPEINSLPVYPCWRIRRVLQTRPLLGAGREPVGPTTDSHMCHIFLNIKRNIF